MATETPVRLPDLGTGVPAAKLIAWLKREGESVTIGDPIAELETDKTTVEIPAPATGVLTRILVPAGTEEVTLDALLAYIGEAGAPTAIVSSAPVFAPGPVSTSASPVSPPGAEVTPVDVGATTQLAAGPTPPASLFVQRMAEAAGLSLGHVSGSGAQGRVTRLDLEAAIGSGPRAARRPESSVSSASAPTSTMLAAAPPDLGPPQPLSALRRVTGERLTLAKQTIPHFYLRTECHMDHVAHARREFNARNEAHLSFTALVVRAAALALRDVPAANTWWLDGKVRACASVDVAVAVMTSAGLIAPVVRRADERSVAATAQELDALAARARAGKLLPDEYANGSCTVSNLGMYGVTGLYPIINPPQTCILGVGAVEERAIAKDGAVVAGLMMTATLSADHRAIDGAAGAEFLAAFKRRIEDPWRLAF
ncbi:MAG: 2-oxo acid dehydrogenase subunit E2 [Acidimicrobiia bacterium]|nr:2-oxo acid dehydrogenase subunit E2 [Acidimicrobiia bacterium]